jgi:hypothetical protein
MPEEVRVDYMLLIYSDPALEPTTDEDRMAQFRAYDAYSRWLREQGLFKAGDPLQPPTDATTVRIRGEERTVTDGPFAETKEWLAGYYVIGAPDLDTAIEAATRCPGAREGVMEVRPLLPFPEMDA